MKTYNYLTWSIISRFGDRKVPGYVALLINVETEEIHIVPTEKEHIELACQILGVDVDYLRNNPEICSDYVPSLIEIRDEEVFGVVTGFSGLESGYNVRHTKKQLDKAHKLALRFVKKGELPISYDFTDKVIYRWQTKQ